MNSLHLTALILTLLSPCWVLAVSPLVTDDAATVELGRVQLNAGDQFSRAASANSHSFLLNPVLGVNSRGELGATFGYQWTEGSGDADANGVTDLLLATKWRLWRAPDDRFMLSTRLDLKLPTASRDQGLGTGNVDIGGVLIATYCWGHTCLDWNVGYTASDASRSVFSDDRWFVGQAVRHELSKRWTLMGETYAILPQTGNAGSTNFHFDGGVQYSVRENFLLSLLVGSAAGRNSPDMLAYCSFSWVF